MTHDPTTAPPPSPPAREAPADSEEAVGHGRVTHDVGSSEEEEQVRDVDPHPDTPDDFDEDAAVGRESIEAVPDPDR